MASISKAKKHMEIGIKIFVIFGYSYGCSCRFVNNSKSTMTPLLQRLKLIFMQIYRPSLKIEGDILFYLTNHEKKIRTSEHNSVKWHDMF